jgi:hypothetical protein
MSTAAETELLEREAKARGLSITEYLTIRAIPPSLARDLAADARLGGISHSASMLPPQPSQPVVRGTGWVDSRPLGPPPGAEPGGAIDRMVEADTQRQRQEAELERQKKILDRVQINMRLAEQLHAFDEEQKRRDEELDPTGQLYSNPDDA